MESTLLFAGLIVSLLVQIIKTSFGINKPVTMLLVVGLSFLFSGLAWYLKQLGLWESFLQIVATASTIYVFFIKTIQEEIRP